MRSIISGMAGLALVGGLGLAPTTVSAQTKGIELNGFAGLYAPTTLDGLEGTREAVRRGSLAFGGRLTYWSGGLLGIEGVAALSPARVRVAAAGGSQFARGTKVLMGAGKLMLNLTPGSHLIGISVGGGPAMVRTKAPLVDRDNANSEVGGVGGLSLRIGVGQNVALRGDAEDFFYKTDFGLGSKLTHDVVLSGGLSIHF